MFEDKTYENIMDEMLDGIDETVDTRQGSIIHDTVSPLALELEQAYSDIGLVEDECFADTASYYYLIKRAAERGVLVREGTMTVVKIAVVPVEIDIPIGTEFNIGEMNYIVTENLGEGYYSITCTETGIEGNNITDDIIPLEDVEGLEEVSVVEIMVPGTDDEDEESLRERYYASFTEASFGGNKADYKEKVNSFATVGGCKVIRAWNGGGTVKLVILGGDFGIASPEVVSEIQEAIDPTQDGGGEGIAPIGHVVTVASAEEELVDVSCTITFQSGYVWDDVSETVSTSIEDYFLSLRKTWEDKDKESLVVRVGQIESIILNTQGIDDVTDIILNGLAGNLSVDAYKIPKVGEVNG